MSHANAALTARARLRLARFLIDKGQSIPQPPTRLEESCRTAQRLVERYLELGEARDRKGHRGRIRHITERRRPA